MAVAKKKHAIKKTKKPAAKSVIKTKPFKSKATKKAVTARARPKKGAKVTQPGTPAGAHATPTQQQLAFSMPQHERIVLVGAGGVGSIVARYLSVFLAHANEDHQLQIIDGDDYEVTNKTRQVFKHLGKKATVLANELIEIASGSAHLLVYAIPEFITPANVHQLIHEGDLVISCVDHHGVRKIISQHVSTLENCTLISGGNDGVDPQAGERGTYGNVQVHIRTDGEDRTPSILELHPEIAGADFAQATFGAAGCGQQVATVPQLLFTNLAVASAILNAMFAYGCKELSYAEVKFDTLIARMLPQIEYKQPK